MDDDWITFKFGIKKPDNYWKFDPTKYLPYQFGDIDIYIDGKRKKFYQGEDKS